MEKILNRIGELTFVGLAVAVMGFTAIVLLPVWLPLLAFGWLIEKIAGETFDKI